MAFSPDKPSLYILNVLSTAQALLGLRTGLVYDLTLSTAEFEQNSYLSQDLLSSQSQFASKT